MRTLLDDLRIYRAGASLAVRAQLHYRRAAAAGLASQAISAGLDILAMLALLHRCRAIDGWGMPGLALLFGLVATALGLALLAGGEIDHLDGMLRQGTFDMLRTRPCRTLLLLAGQGFELRRLGRVGMGLTVLGVGLGACHRGDPAAIGVCAVAIAGGMACFLGIMIAQAAVTFWTVDGLEVANVLTFGGEYMVSYPLSIYPRWMMRLLLSIVPIGAITYPPALLLTHRLPPEIPVAAAVAAPLLGIIPLVVGLWLWRVAIRHHQSTGS